MNTIRFESREAFVKALEGRRKFWREYDKRQEREHKAAEQEWLVKARAKMREAIKWDYATLKEAVDYSGRLPLSGDAPSCPRLVEPRLDRVLAALRLTNGKTFTVDSSGVWADAHDLLISDPDARTKVC
jgi:hypothetical protein